MEYYSIGEVCRLLDVKPYVLRYWEQEFPVLSPRKDRTGKRVYTISDLNLLYRIRHLLYSEKYTIEGAKKRIWEELSGQKADLRASVRGIRETLINIALKIDDTPES